MKITLADLKESLSCALSVREKQIRVGQSTKYVDDRIEYLRIQIAGREALGLS